jgi:hypothetical protein
MVADGAIVAERASKLFQEGAVVAFQGLDLTVAANARMNFPGSSRWSAAEFRVTRADR